MADTLIHLHIPKAGGTTLNSILNRLYPAGDRCTVLPFNRSLHQSINRFINLPDREKKKIRLLNGHQGFGLHRHLPQPATYVAMLRDPVKRAVSYYYHVRRDPPHRFFNEAISMDLKAFIENEVSVETENDMTRRISGLEDPVEVADACGSRCTDRHYEAALKNLDNHFCFAAVTEYFDESILLLTDQFDLGSPYYVRKNVGKNAKPLSGLPEDALETIRYRNRYDLALHAEAKKRLKMKIEEGGEGFQKRLKAFRSRNGIYTMLYRIYFSPYNSLRFLKHKLMKQASC